MIDRSEQLAVAVDARHGKAGMRHLAEVRAFAADEGDTTRRDVLEPPYMARGFPGTR